MKKLGRIYINRITASAIAIALAISSLPAMAATDPSAQLQNQFAAAAKEFKVPEQVLLAVSYNESRWTSHGTESSNNNGYGLMNLRSRTFTTDTDDAKGEHAHRQSRTATVKASRYSLDDAAKALKLQASNLKADNNQNIRGGAAVLAKYARDLNGGKLPADTNGWYGTVAAYSGALTTQQAQRFADGVYDIMEQGARLTTQEGQKVTLKADPALNPDTDSVNSLGLTATAAATGPVDCPTTITCTFVPAAYTQNSADPTDYGNYDTANRPVSQSIKKIVIHDAEGSYSGTVSWFQNPSSYVSAHYVIRSSDGDVTEMVRPDDVAWSAGNWYENTHAINIEHEGYAEQGSTWYTEAMYRSSAELVRYLAAQYNIPLDREHIIGHDQVPGLTGAKVSGMHWDPGPYWDWNHYMDLILGTPATGASVDASTKLVTISPTFATNKPTIRKCLQNNKRCVLKSQGASVTYLRTQPSNSAPLLTDKYKHTDGSAGTNLVSDWSATAPSGRTYAYAGQSGDWTAVWFGSQKGWFYNPGGTGKTAFATNGTVITPASGLTSATVYGAAYPESAAYPSSIPVQPQSPLYTIPAGQSYVVGDSSTPTDYYYAPTIDSSKPGDHTVVVGGEIFYQISYNHRVGYVKASEVSVTTY